MEKYSLSDIAAVIGNNGYPAMPVLMGGGFGGCTINLVKEELYDAFIARAKEAYKEKYGKLPKVYDVVISDGSRKLC
jgi:galactokinase